MASFCADVPLGTCSLSYQINSYIVNITLTYIHNYFTSRYYVMEQRGGALWRMDM